jgi:hypothetical protein
VAYDTVASATAPNSDAAASQIARRLDIEVLGLLHHAAGGHAHRRGQALQEHLDLIPNDLPGMLLTYDYWQEPSRPLRQYLWAYVQEDQQRGRTLIEVLGPQRVKRIMRYLAEDYWVRYLGWPDLVSWREGDSGPEGVAFIEVKSSNDKLSDDRRSWIEGNHKHLQLPFRLAKVNRAQRLDPKPAPVN